MRLFVVSNDEDTCTGLRLAGIEGVVVSGAADAVAAIETAAADSNIGVIAVNRALMNALGGYPSEFRAAHGLPILVEVPDTGGLPASGSVAKYVREAVGIKE